MRACIAACSMLVVLATGLTSALADVISFQRITNHDPLDPTYINNFIDSGRQYTHKLDMGQAATAAATVNGVTFDRVSGAMLNAGTVPGLDLTYFASNGSAADHAGGAGGGGGTWPPNNVVAGTGLANLINDFAYNGTGTSTGNYQEFTLTGLSQNTEYLFRVYMRQWEGPTGTTTRRQDFTFTVGGVGQTVAVNEDRPFSHAPFTNTGDSDAWFLEYRYNTGANTSLTVRMTTQQEPNNGGFFTNGSFHTYAMTNEVVPEPGAAAMLAGCVVAWLIASRRRR